jgi:hypothetical protein
MNTMKVALIVALGIWAAGAVEARDSIADRFDVAPGTGEFSENEWSLDVYGFHSSRDKDGSSRDAWGPGVGFNYFFTENLGVGADTYMDAFSRPYLLNGSAIVRYPLKDIGLAPYGFAGFGRQWEHASQWTGHIGGGLEYRFNPRTGVMLDLREVFTDQSKDYTLVRFGVRFVF